MTATAVPGSPAETRSRGASGQIGAAATVPALVLARALSSADRVARRQRRLGVWEEITWRALAERAAVYAAGLTARGVRRGDHVALVVGPGADAAAVDAAVQGLGAVVVALVPGRPIEEARGVLLHYGVRVAVVEDAEHAHRFGEPPPVTPSADTALDILVIDTRNLGPAMPSLASLAEAGGSPQDAFGEWQQSVKGLDPTAPAVVGQTVGGSGAPRTLALTGANLVAAAHAAAGAFGLRAGDEILSYLPPAHLVEQVLSYGAAALAGAVVNVGGGPGAVVGDCAEVHPNVLLGVPSVWRRFEELARTRAENAGSLARGTGRLARGWARRRARARLGLDRIRVPLSALAPLTPAAAAAVAELGIGVRSCYGTVECCGLATCAPALSRRASDPASGADSEIPTPDAVAAGVDVGVAVPGAEVGVGEDGEVWVRGPQVARGAAGKDGRVRTGDRGRMVGERLVLEGRTGDLLVTAAGARVDASAVAAALEAQPLVRRAVVAGDGRPFVAALLEFDPPALSAWAADAAIPFTSAPDLLDRPEVHQAFARDVEAANAGLAPEARIQSFRVLDGPLLPGRELTITGRLRRDAALAQHRSALEEVYRP